MPVASVYIDHEFNCRGWFSPTTCIELAKDVARRGLQQPIVVRSLRVEDLLDRKLPHEQDQITKGFTHKLIAGHRRLTAYKINDAEVIPAIVRPNTLTNFEERDINATENLHRKDLSFYQEANAIHHYWIAGWTRQDIADQINKSAGWVQLRVSLLEMPVEIHELANQGYVLATDMTELRKIHDPIAQLKAAGFIRDQRRKGQKGLSVLGHMKRKDKPSTKKHRKKTELQEIQEIMQAVQSSFDPEKTLCLSDLVTIQGNSITTRILAWAAGEITARDVHAAIKDYATLCGGNYPMPEFEME